MTYRQPFRGEYPVTQRYGEKDTSAFHTGIDYACPIDTEILASGAGLVVFAGLDKTGFGNLVIIQHNDGNATLYAHLSKIGVVLRQKVEQGQVIGLSGNTGNSTGPHLHFEARRRWADYKSHFDPMDLPLICVEDAAFEQQKPAERCLKAADQLGEEVKIVAPAGAWGWSSDFGKRSTVFPEGTVLHYTGRTAERLGYTYCEVYPEPVKYWVAVHDGTTQILDNA